MPSHRQFVRQLSSALLNGPWSRVGMLERTKYLLEESPPWLALLLDAVIHRFGLQRPPSPGAMAEFIATHPAFMQAWADRERRPNVRRWPLDSPVAATAPDFVDGELPCLSTSQDLADWLGLQAGVVDWLADSCGRQTRIEDGPLKHYRYRWVGRRRGAPRLLEIPKVRLKQIQRRILTEILDLCPPHPNAYGFRKGRSCHGYAAPHCNREMVLRMDLSDFFPSIPASRVHALFRVLGYPWKTARLLTGLCTDSVPTSVFPRHGVDWQLRQQLRFPHLPQGAPTSPALANLVAYGLDRRLSGLARHRGLMFTRYADDLAFSGPRCGVARRDNFIALVAAIALEEGFRVNHRKTRAMGAAHAQRLTGISVNRFPNIPRELYDRLKATLYNCARFGPDSQNRGELANFRAHLRGRIEHVASLNPKRGERLRRLFATIQWPPFDD